MPAADRRPRYLEDYRAGDSYDCGTVSVDEQQILEFGRRFDPQPMHVDPQAAARTPYGGLIASGWHTGSLLMRLFVDNVLPAAGSYGSPALEQVRWPAPVRPGDTLRLRVSVLGARRSRSKPDRGIVRTHAVMNNQDDAVVLDLIAVTIVAAHDQHSPVG